MHRKKSTVALSLVSPLKLTLCLAVATSEAFVTSPGLPQKPLFLSNHRRRDRTSPPCSKIRRHGFRSLPVSPLRRSSTLSAAARAAGTDETSDDDESDDREEDDDVPFSLALTPVRPANPPEKPETRKIPLWKIRQRGMAAKPFVPHVRSFVRRCAVAIAVYLAVGAAAYRLVLERPTWTWIDAAYFCAATFTTTGFGDLVPHSAASKAFTVLYGLSGVSIVGFAIGVLWQSVHDRQEAAVQRAQFVAQNRVMQLFRRGGDYGAEEDVLVYVDDDYLDDDEDLALEAEEEDYEEEDEPREEPRPESAPVTLRGAILKGIISQTPVMSALGAMGLLLGKIEGWSASQFLYYGVSAATTIGYGDVVPCTQLGRLLAVIFIPLSVYSLGDILSQSSSFFIDRAASKAEKSFMRRGVTFRDLELMDLDDDGEVNETDFVTFMLVAMNKCDVHLVRDLKRLFFALDVGKDGILHKEDLVVLALRKRDALSLKRRRRRKKNSGET